jgi:hypothetical protein
MANFQLKYLFGCRFADGTVVNQTPADVSSIDPQRSEFYDVLQTAESSPVRQFWLKGDDTTLLVDLTDGHFELNGIPFKAHETLPLEFPDYRLIFYRQHKHQFNLDKEELAHQVDYCIGWQTTIAGKNYKETITIN